MWNITIFHRWTHRRPQFRLHFLLKCPIQARVLKNSRYIFWWIYFILGLGKINTRCCKRENLKSLLIANGNIMRCNFLQFMYAIMRILPSYLIFALLQLVGMKPKFWSNCKLNRGTVGVGSISLANNTLPILNCLIDEGWSSMRIEFFLREWEIEILSVICNNGCIMFIQGFCNFIS